MKKKTTFPYVAPLIFQDNLADMSVLCTSDVNEGAGSEDIGPVTDFDDLW